MLWDEVLLTKKSGHLHVTGICWPSLFGGFNPVNPDTDSMRERGSLREPVTGQGEWLGHVPIV